VEKLWDNAFYFRARMGELGFDTGHTQTPITPVMVGEATLAKELSMKLFERNVFAQAIAFPTVPKGKARIRVMVSASHTRDDLDYAVSAFAEAGKELGIIG
jgi:glycine C-acetyltransferase